MPSQVMPMPRRCTISSLSIVMLALQFLPARGRLLFSSRPGGVAGHRPLDQTSRLTASPPSQESIGSSAV
jgi:hypothetical protein